MSANRIPPDTEDGVLTVCTDPNDPPLSGACARNPYADELLDIRDEDLLERRCGARHHFYPWS